jgi:peptide/nickel transport system substrate-binding protein
MKFAGKSRLAPALTLVAGLAVMISAMPAQAAHHSGPPVNQSKKSGTVIYSDWQFPDTLNPLQTSIGASGQTIATILASLAVFDGKGQLVPDLLTNIPSKANHEILNGGKTIILKLKPKQYWSSGKLITNQDILFGWHMYMDPVTGPYCNGTCDHIKSISLKGKYTAILHLKGVFAPILSEGLPTVWPHDWPALGLTPHAAATTLATNSSFNFENSSYWTDGPYQVQSYVNNDRIVLTPMKYYHVHPGPYLSKLIFSFFSSKSDLIAAAASDQTNVTTDYTLADIPALTASRSVFKTSVTPAFLIENLQVNQYSKMYKGKPNPLRKTKVRQALALSLDKVGIVQSALAVSKKVAQKYVAYTPFVKTAHFVQEYSDTGITGAWDPFLHRYVGYSARSVADAKKLLKQAGYSKGFPLDFITTSGNSVRSAEYAVIASNWSRIGVTTNLTLMPASAMFADWYHGGPIAHEQFQIGMWSIGTAPDPDSLHIMISSQYLDAIKGTHSTLNQDWSGMRDHVIDSNMNKAADTVNASVRARLYKQVQEHLAQNADWIQVYYRPVIVTVDKHVKGAGGTPFFDQETWNVYAWHHVS